MNRLLTKNLDPRALYRLPRRFGEFFYSGVYFNLMFLDVQDDTGKTVPCLEIELFKKIDGVITPTKTITGCICGCGLLLDTTQEPRGVDTKTLKTLESIFRSNKYVKVLTLNKTDSYSTFVQ